MALDVSKDNLMPIKWWSHIGDIETYWYEIRFAQFYLLVQRTSKKIYKLVGFLLKWGKLLQLLLSSWSDSLEETSVTPLEPEEEEAGATFKSVLPFVMKS